MAIIRNRYYFGPAGDLRVLPSVMKNAGVSPSPNLAGTLTRSISGSPTKVSYGAKRTWNLKWDMRSEQDALELHRLEAGLRDRVMRRMYFLDAKNTNFFQPSVSDCAGSARRPQDAFAWTTGVLTRNWTGVFHPDLAGHTDGNAVYQAALADVSSVFAKPRLPVLPGSSYRFSGYFSAPTAGNITLGLQAFDSAGSYISTIYWPAIALTTTPTLYAQVLAAANVPAGAATLGWGFLVRTANLAVNFNGWMLQYDQSTAPAGGWYPGAGGTECIVSGFDVVYDTYNLRSIAASIEEV